MVADIYESETKNRKAFCMTSHQSVSVSKYLASIRNLSSFQYHILPTQIVMYKGGHFNHILPHTTAQSGRNPYFTFFAAAHSTCLSAFCTYRHWVSDCVTRFVGIFDSDFHTSNLLLL